MQVFSDLERDVSSGEQKNNALEWAKEKLTKRGLIAFDLDKTVMEQGDPNEIKMFVWSICHTLIHLADQGYRISAVTGNSLEQLSSRFTKALLSELSRFRKLELLSQFHLFCNGASLYIEFPTEMIEELIEKQDMLDEDDGNYSYSDESLKEFAFRHVFDDTPKFEIKSNFISPEYVNNTMLTQGRVNMLLKVANSVAESWWEEVLHDINSGVNSVFRRDYFINYPASDTESNERVDNDLENSDMREVSVFKLYNGEKLNKPKARIRGCSINGIEFCTQIALNHILSFRHSRTVLDRTRDPREKLVGIIKNKINSLGIDQISVVPGGRGTIDITDQDANKKDAILYLVRALSIKGDRAKGEGIGINVIYFGDEVVLRGNDYDVTEIDGIQVFAVNERRERVPIGSNIRIPRTHQVGPSATDFLLTRLRLVTGDLLGSYVMDYMNDVQLPRYGHKSAIRIFREQIEKEIIQEKIGEGSLLWKSGKMDITILQAISTLLTILMRDGELPRDIAKRVNNMIDTYGKDAQTLFEKDTQTSAFIALGGSHWDS